MNPQALPAAEDSFAAALIQSGTAILVGIVLLVFFEFARTRAETWMQARFAERLATVEKKTAALISVDTVFTIIEWLALALRLTVWGVVLLVVLQRALLPFPATHEVGLRLADLVLEPIEALALAFARSVPSILFVAVVVAGSIGGVRLSRALFARLESGKLHIAGFYPEWSKPTHRLVSVFVIAAGAIIAYPYIPGSSSEAFKGVTVFLGLLVSLGSSSIIGNLLNGFVITYMRAFKTHDVIRIGDTTGQVVDTTLLVTRLVNIQGIEITIPNSQVLAAQVANFSRGGEAMASTAVTIGYDVAWRHVEQLLVGAALRVDLVKKHPAPYVLKRGLLDHAIAYELFFAATEGRLVPIALSRVHEEVLDAFNEAGIQIMSPRYVLDPKEPKVVHARPG